LELNRRDLLRSSWAVGAGALLQPSRTRAAASDRIRVGVIGCGGRGRDHLRYISKVPNVEIVALCDPDQTRLEQRAAELASLSSTKPALHQDLREVLDGRGIDAITVATCNHWHALAAIWGCQAGKHVYAEKPLCHDFFSGAQMVAASRKYNRIVQGGTQRRSNGYIRRAIHALREGVIGDVYMARCVHYQQRDSVGFKPDQNPPATLNWDVWLGPGPKVPFNANLHPYNWHWFWAFGNGELGNNGIHYIDIARWGLNQEFPTRVFSAGGRYGYKDQGETPNTQTVTFEFANKTQMEVEIRGRFTNGEDGLTSGLAFYGSNGYMVMDNLAGNFKVYLGEKKTPEPDLGKLDDVDKSENYSISHFQNFFDAVRGNNRGIQTADVNETYLSTALCLFGNISYRLGRSLEFDAGRRQFANDKEANAMLRGDYRPPFTIPNLSA
jgi:predicted dehydrogenase